MNCNELNATELLTLEARGWETEANKSFIRSVFQCASELVSVWDTESVKGESVLTPVGGTTSNSFFFQIMNVLEILIFFYEI